MNVHESAKSLGSRLWLRSSDSSALQKQTGLKYVALFVCSKKKKNKSYLYIDSCVCTYVYTCAVSLLLGGHEKKKEKEGSSDEADWLVVESVGELLAWSWYEFFVVQSRRSYLGTIFLRGRSQLVVVVAWKQGAGFFAIIQTAKR